MLNPKQASILFLSGQDFSKKEVAAQLCIPVSTVSKSLLRLRRQHGVATTKELVDLLVEKGQLKIPLRDLTEGPFTEQQAALAPFLALGTSYKAIANHCNLSVRKVRAVAVSMLRGFACRDRTQLAIYLVRRGL